MIQASRVANALILILALASINMDCGKKNLEKPAQVDGQKEIASTQQDSFKITLSTGGGLTGLYEGYHLLSDGRIEHWQRYPAREDSILWSRNVSPEDIEIFRKQLEDSGVLEKSYKATGNVTTVVTYSSARGTYNWSWRGAGTIASIPSELTAWYREVTEFCQSSSEKGE